MNPQTDTNTLPAIGQPWPGQGGIYAGISRGEDGQPDAHLIVAVDTIDPAPWKKSCELAQAYSADGHTDFRAPTCAESALCFANLKAEFCEVYDDWYWTNTQLSARSVWMQNFHDGYQDWDYKGREYRVRPVRRFNLHQFRDAFTAQL